MFLQAPLAGILCHLLFSLWGQCWRPLVFVFLWELRHVNRHLLWLLDWSLACFNLFIGYGLKSACLFLFFVANVFISVDSDSILNPKCLRTIRSCINGGHINIFLFWTLHGAQVLVEDASRGTQPGLSGWLLSRSGLGIALLGYSGFACWFRADVLLLVVINVFSCLGIGSWLHVWLNWIWVIGLALFSFGFIRFLRDSRDWSGMAITRLRRPPHWTIVCNLGESQLGQRCAYLCILILNVICLWLNCFSQVRVLNAWESNTASWNAQTLFLFS